MRIISTGHKMTLVNGFRAHHNGFVEADFLVEAKGLVFCTDRGVKSCRHRAWKMGVRPWDREVALPSLSSSRRQQRRSVHPGLSPSIVVSHARFCRKSKSPQKRHQSVAPMLLGVHCCQPAPDHSQQACRIHTWQAMGKEKTTPWQASSHRLRTPPWGSFRPWRFDMGVCIFLW